MSGLVSYSGSSSESEEESEELRCTAALADRKRKLTYYEVESSPLLPHSPEKIARNEDTESHPKRKKSTLPIPESVVDMFGSRETARIAEKPEMHGGRVRSFPHLEGNWASYVYVPVSVEQRLVTLISELQMCLRPFTFERMDDLHLSLSRTVCIRHHWIQPLTESLKQHFSGLESCLCDITSLKLYTNDEKTRTFLSLEVSPEGGNLTDYIAAVDSCLHDFNLPAFYKDPSFHISLLWSVGDVVSQISEKTKRKIQALTRDFLNTNTDLSVLAVNQVCLKTGNKEFTFHLRHPDE